MKRIVQQLFALVCIVANLAKPVMSTRKETSTATNDTTIDTTNHTTTTTSVFTRNVTTSAAFDTPSTTTTATTVVVGCGGVAHCINNNNHCSDCLAAINASSGYPHSVTEYYQLSITAQQNLFVVFFETLVSTTSCWTNSTPESTLRQALIELTEPTCVDTYGMPVNMCLLVEYACYVNPDCQQCLSTLYAWNSNKRDVLQSPACVATDSALLEDLEHYCESFPQCTFAKLQCLGTPECAPCLDTLGRGDGAAAARQCPASGPTAQTLDKVVSFCVDGDNVVCDFYMQRCGDIPNCYGCLEQLLGSESNVRAITADWSTPVCQMALRDSFAIDYLSNMAVECPRMSQCQSMVANCLFDYRQTCIPCINGTAPPDSPICKNIFQAFDFITACQACPDSVYTINALVFITAVIGGVSTVVCLVVVVALVAHGRDRDAMRDRIVVGLMIANTIYSTANTLPLNALQSDVEDCGRHAMSFDAIRFGRAWWFCGKYGLVSFELLIVGASIRALLRGLSAVPGRVEIVLHLSCCAAAISAFIVFYMLCADINAAGYNVDTENEAITNVYDHTNRDDDLDDETPATIASQKFKDGRQRYDDLVREMLVVWDVLVGLAIVLWTVLRVIHHHALRTLRIEESQAARAEAADEWADTRRSVWNVRRRLLLARREAFVEVAKPLEPYILVFIAFAAPAFVMSTEYCQNHSGAEAATLSFDTNGGASNITYGTCDAWCEFLLSFRSPGTVAVYLFMSRQRRVEIVAVAETCRKFVARVRECLCHKRASYAPLNRSSCSGNDDDGNEMVELLVPSSIHHDDHSHNDRALEHPTPASWHITEHDITKLRPLGHGAFGDVWEGWLQPNDCRVAIKVLYTGTVDDDGDLIDPKADEDFSKEVEALQSIDSPHLIKFFGFGSTESGNRFIVTELMAGGSLESVLHDHERELPWRLRVGMGLQIALGMEYLHRRQMLHRDLKSANVLLDDNLKAKVCDFGLTRLARPVRQYVVHSPFTGVTRRLPAVGDAMVQNPRSACPMSAVAVCIEDARGRMTKAAGTLLWMAPEVYRGDEDYGPAVDVYSFGIVLWELATRETPWQELPINETAFFAALNRALQTGRRPRIPDEVVAAVPQFVVVMQRCWVGDPANRPLFSQLTSNLAACLRDCP